MSSELPPPFPPPCTVESSSESSSSEGSDSSSDFDSSDSESFQDPSSDLSPEDEEDMEEEEEEVEKENECIVISSDEESMELEPPVTPCAPLTPGAQLDLGLQEWTSPIDGEEEEEEENRRTPPHPHTCDLEAVMELQTRGQEHLQLLSPLALPGH